jgi:hypothetical protein
MVTITVDLSYVHTSKREALSVEEALAWFASQLPEDTTLMDEEGEPDLSTLAAIAICKGCLRGKALAKDGARVAAKVAPSRIYTARLADTSKEAATTLEAAKVEAYKVSGIAPPSAKPKATPAPAKALEAQIAKLMAENASLAAKVTKPVEPKPAKVTKPAKVAKPVEPKPVEAKAKPVEAKAKPVEAKPAKVETSSPSLADLVAWFKADSSRHTADAIRTFPGLSPVKVANCYRAAKV